MLPEPFRACHVQRLSPYFVALRSSCQKLALRNQDNPRIVILSQGPTSANYFEDAYLSRYLGYTLVETADLTVRGRRVWIKTLGGLYPVDVVIRRPNSGDCDPLELASDSRGIAGLVEVVRAGNVAISNPLGSGLVESPILMAFASELCRALLGEELLIPGVATWWCGDPQSRTYALKNLDRLEIKRAFRRRGKERLATVELRRLSREQLADEIEREPFSYVAQERVERSSLPVWSDRKVAPSMLALRAFAFYSGESYEVLQGGLARTSNEHGSLELSLAAGEGSKDTWIQGEHAPAHVSLLPSMDDVIELRRGGDDLPSRAADDIYWLGRHIERADAAARLLREVTSRLATENETSSPPVMTYLMRTMVDQGQIEPGFIVDGIRDQMPDIERCLPIAIFDATAIGSLRSILAKTYSTASRVRDRLSADSWRVLLHIDERFRVGEGETCDLTVMLNMSNELIVDLAAFHGMVSESMTRTQAYYFIDLGVRIERTLQTAQLLANAVVDETPVTGEILESLLHVCDSLMTYRYRYLSNLSFIPVLDLLLTDETNPRSILYQLLRIHHHLEQLPNSKGKAHLTEEGRLLLSATHTVQMLDIASLSTESNESIAHKLHTVFEQLSTALPELSHTITNKYMIHSGPISLLAGMDKKRTGDS